MSGLLVKYLCPVCQTEVEGRGENTCPKCGLRSVGTEVDDFDTDLQKMHDVLTGWDTLLQGFEDQEGAEINAQAREIRIALYQIITACNTLAMRAGVLRERL